ncbi:hypothetical protein L1987_49104 [Smallanthus sonchifolius]|uniref:Uncharacterized protein n=1 Tax=Smallanthus sonchifolius TaxID=185202 RepID=A0ACB9FUB8_9ASTR|nr:hypothetical protein L1987_49104 [Smallanthus sonchifolius]
MKSSSSLPFTRQSSSATDDNSGPKSFGLVVSEGRVHGGSLLSLESPRALYRRDADLETGAAMEEGKVSKYGFEIVKAFSNNHLDLRPSYFSIFKGNENCEKDRYSLIRDPNDFQQGIYDKPLSCFGCGVRWYLFLIRFAFPLMWYYAAFLYFRNYYQQDPWERAGLAASAIAINAVDGMKLYDELFNDSRVRKMVSLVNDLRATGRWDLFQGKSLTFSR